MRNPICILRTIWRSIRYGGWPFGYVVDGCDYVDEEIVHGATVEVSRCECCGRYELTWRRGDGAPVAVDAEVTKVTCHRE